MNRFLLFSAFAVALLVGFVSGGAFVAANWSGWHGAYRTDRLVAAVEENRISPGSSIDEIPLLKPKVSHRRKLPGGREEYLAIYQDDEHIILLEATDREIDRLVLWKSGFAEAEKFLEAAAEPSP